VRTAFRNRIGGHHIDYLAVIPTIKGFPTTLNGRHIMLVDTSGSYIRYGTHSAMLRELRDWLSDKYCDEKLLSGLIYLQCIDRVGPARGDIPFMVDVLRDLMGQELKNVVMATTQWHKVPYSSAYRAERRLVEGDWKDLLSLGVRTARFDGDREAAVRLMEMFDGPDSEAVPRTKSSGLQDIEQTSQEQNAAECAKEDQNEAISRPGKMGHGSLPKYDSALQTSAEMINSDDDFLVAVLGVTGSGKSSFIKLIVQDDRIAIGDGLETGKTLSLKIDCSA
jgi:hypothetical protein